MEVAAQDRDGTPWLIHHWIWQSITTTTSVTAAVAAATTTTFKKFAFEQSQRPCPTWPVD